jgi:N-methylhydantoinase A
VTDAHLLLGRMDPGVFFDGEDPPVAAVRDGLADTVADPLGMEPEEAAAGVLEVANANMERALRVVSVERGHDPREFGLVAYGGAGPLHACRLAEELDIPRVLVPASAGVLSALGLLISDTVYDYGTTMVRPWAEVDPGTVAETLERFEREGREQLAGEGFDPERRRLERSLDLRYAGQSFDLRVPVPEEAVDGSTLEAVAERFHERHERRYGHASPDEPLELVAVRLRAVGVVEPPELSPPTEGGPATPAGERAVTFDGRVQDTPVYRREELTAATAFDGPAVVQSTESTTVVRPGQHASVDDAGNLIVET